MQVVFTAVDIPTAQKIIDKAYENPISLNPKP